MSVLKIWCDVCLIHMKANCTFWPPGLLNSSPDSSYFWLVCRQFEALHVTTFSWQVSGEWLNLWRRLYSHSQIIMYVIDILSVEIVRITQSGSSRLILVQSLSAAVLTLLNWNTSNGCHENRTPTIVVSASCPHRVAAQSFKHDSLVTRSWRHASALTFTASRGSLNILCRTQKS